MGHDNGSGIVKHLSATCMIPVIMAVKEIPDRFVRDGPDGFDKSFRVVRIHRFNREDAFARHHEHGEIGASRVSIAIHARVDLGGMRGQRFGESNAGAHNDHEEQTKNAFHTPDSFHEVVVDRNRPVSSADIASDSVRRSD